MELSELEGLIPEEVGRVLARYAAIVPRRQVIVEVGSYKGKSTCYLASTAIAPVIAVDPWYSEGNNTGRFGFAERKTFETFLSQIKMMGFEYQILPIVGFSTDVAGRFADHFPSPVGLLFVDGDHSEKSVYEDVMAWGPHLTDNATIILDDYDTPRNPGVKKAADRLVDHYGPYVVKASRLAVFNA